MFGIDVEETPKLPEIWTVEMIALPDESVIVPLIEIVSPTTTVGFAGVVSIYVAGPLKIIVSVSLALVIVVHTALTIAPFPSFHDRHLLLRHLPEGGSVARTRQYLARWRASKSLSGVRERSAGYAV